MTKPRKIKQTAPQFSNLARAARLEGQVVLQAVLDEEGVVTSVKPIKTLPLCLTEEAMLAVQQWRFESAMLDGEPIPDYYNLLVNFRLE